MRKITTFLTIGVSALLLTACGGGGESNPPLNNPQPPPVDTQPPVEDDKYNVAIKKIMNYADDNSNPVPTVVDYKDANVIGVETDNLRSLNIYIESLTSNDVDSTAKIQEIVLSTNVSFEPDRVSTDWIKFSYTSELTGEEITQLSLSSSSLDASFVISCSDGMFESYHISTGFITGSGYVAYRFGNTPIVYDTWNECEDCGFDYLYPSSASISFIEKFLYTPDVIFRLDKFGGGLPEGNLGNYGFSAMIDQSREMCGWSENTFPKDNGWGKEYPTSPPEWAKESTYDTNVKDQFRLIAWIDENSQGEDQLLVRVGDQVGPCKGRSYVSDDQLFVIQDNEKIPVVANSKIEQTCEKPSIYALNGQFDIHRPFLLNEYTKKILIDDIETLVTSISFP